MVLKIKYDEFANKLKQTLLNIFNENYDAVYYDENEKHFFVGENYEDYYDNNPDIVPLIEMVDDIISLPDTYKTAHKEKPSDIIAITSLVVEDIFIINSLINKPAGEDMLKYDYTLLPAMNMITN